MEIADVQPVAPPPLSTTYPRKEASEVGKTGRGVGLPGDCGPADLRSADMVHSEDRGGGEERAEGEENRVHPPLSLFLTNNRELQQAQELLQEKKRKAAPSPESLSVKRLNKSFQRIFIFLWRLFLTYRLN